MPYYDSPSLYIDFARLAPPEVIETINYEDLLTIYKNQVVLKNPALAQAVALEQSPTNVILEAEAYGEMIVRARVNAAARAVMLPFARGTDLDVLCAFYDVSRLALVATPRPYLTNPEDWESDERLRHRAQIAAEAFSTAGTQGSYIFHALSADATIRDASAMKVDDRGGVKVSIMNSGSDPTPTSAQLDAVTIRLNKPNIKVLTDVVSVSPATVVHTDIVASLTLYPGPDAALVMADVQKALTSLRERISLLGRNLNRSSIISALSQEGVEDVNLTSPSADIDVDFDSCVLIDSATVTVEPIRRI